MRARDIISRQEPAEFTNAELTHRIRTLEEIVSLLSDRLREVDGKDFIQNATTRGIAWDAAPKDVCDKAMGL